MYSKSVLNIVGLQLNVYGLDEYKSLPEETPLVVMFFTPGLMQTQEEVEEPCQALCSLNDSWQDNNRFLVMISIDQPNAGTKYSYDDEPWPMPGSYTHQEFISKMCFYAKSTAYSISNIIESFDVLVFGPKSESFVEDWGVIGFSMGGIIAQFAASFEPKITTVVIMACGIDMPKWFPHMSKALGLDPEFCSPSKYLKHATAAIRNMSFDLRSKKLLIMNTEKDELSPPSINGKVIEDFRNFHTGREDHDWKAISLQGKEHFITDDYLEHAKQWTGKWLVSKGARFNARL